MISTQFLSLPRVTTLSISYPTQQKPVSYTSPESKFDQCPPISFPAKLTRVLYERYKAGKDGVVVLSCELIDNNGKELQKCVNEYIDDWGLEEGFKTWINEKNTFCGLHW